MKDNVVTGKKMNAEPHDIWRVNFRYFMDSFELTPMVGEYFSKY